MTQSTVFRPSAQPSAARRKARTLRIIQALVFIGLGGWCRLAPHTVERLALKPEYQHLSATTALLMGCFGAQAVLCGSLMLLARFEPRRVCRRLQLQSRLEQHKHDDEHPRYHGSYAASTQRPGAAITRS